MRLLSVLLALLMILQGFGPVLAETGNNSENLALGATLTVSSNLGGAWDKSLLNDGVTLGNTSAYGWSSQKLGVGTSATEPVVLPTAVTATFDFGTETAFNQWKLYPRNADLTTPRLFPIDYTVQVSNDNAAWTTVATIVNGDVPAVSTDPAVVTLDQAVSGRYVKFTFTKINLPDTWKNNLHVQLTELEIYNAQVETTVRVFSDLVYADQSERQKLDIHLPDGEGPFPVVVYYHGGAWLSGDKADVPEAQGILNSLVAKGYAVVCANYRYASEAQWPAQIYDCKAAIRYVRAHAEEYGLDASRIAVFGSSAGGHLALMTALTNGMTEFEDLTMGNAAYSSEVMAVVSNYGISDLTKWTSRSNLYDSVGDPLEKLLGADWTEEQALAASPITYVDENSVPVLLCHGQDDAVVEFYHSSDLEKAIVAANGISKVDTFYPAEGAHGDSTYWNSAEPTAAVTDFLGKWFNPHTTLSGNDNSQTFSNVDLKTWPNATTMLKYGTQSDSQILHIVTPETGDGPFPTIVFIHGGGFTGLNSSNGSVYWVGRATLEAVNAGYAVAFVDYRLSGEAKYPAPVHDIKAAIRYLRANAAIYKLDVDRFAIWGESAGGHLASFVALTGNEPAYEDLSMGYADYSSAVQACVAWYPITNLTSAYNNSKGWTANLMGYAAGTDPESENYQNCWDASPVAQASADDCPVYLQHGMADTLVEYQDSVDLYNALVDAGGNGHRLELFPGLIHGPGGKFLSERNLYAIYNWLNDKLDIPVLPEDQKAAYTVDDMITDLGDITRSSKTAIEAARAAYEALSNGAKALVENLSVLEAAEAALIKLYPSASSDGRVSIQNGQLVIPGGDAVTYYTTQTFSGDYTVEMRACVDYQALGLLVGNGSPNPALWCMALVNPVGVWIHQPGSWSASSINKVANANVATGAMVDLKIEIVGSTVKTYINEELISTDTMPTDFSAGPLGLRFSKKEAGKVDYIKVTQNGKLLFRDDFNYIDSSNWDIPVVDYNVNLALGKTALTNSDVGLAQFFKIDYLTDGITQSDVSAGNYGYSSNKNASGVVVAVNLGELSAVNQIVLYPRNDVATADGRAANFPTDFSIQYSTGGTTDADFITIDTITNGSCASPTEAYSYSFDTVDAVLIRLVVNGVSGAASGESSAYVQLAEMEVYLRDASKLPEEEPRDFLDLAYADQSERQKLDIHLPDGEGPFPVVVYYHGGAWLTGDKATAPEAQGILDAIVEKGYAVVCANYRYASEAQWPAQIYDCKAAIRYIRARADEYGLDASRIAVFGASAGGHLALMTALTNGVAEFEDLSMGNATYSSEVMAVVSNYCISDLTKWDSRSSLYDSVGDPIEKLLGADWTEEQALAASPITYVSEDSVPVYLAHGQNDSLVEPYHSSDLEEALKAVIDPELVDTYYPADAPHADPTIWNGTDSITNIIAFLQKRFEPHVPLTNGDNYRAYSRLDLSTYANATLNLQYASLSDTQKLHIVTPDGEGPFKTIIFIHGGGFSGGNSSNGTVLYTARGPIQALEDGYAVVFVDYRCGGEAKYPAPIYDIKAAIRYLRANAETYNLDADRFAIWGESAGGHLASFVAATSNDLAYEDLTMGNADYSSAVQACVALYPITDLTTDRNQQYAPTLLGYGAADNYNGCLAASPVAHITEDICPFYLQHGLADNEVEYQDSIQLYDLIKEAGQDNAKLDLYPGINHATKKFLDEKNVDKLIAWMDETFAELSVEEAEAVDAMINAIGKVALNSKEAIEAARIAYDGLSDEAKALVKNLDILEAAEARLVELKRFDINLDDTADSADVVFLLSGINGDAELDAELADINGDGKVSLSDALKLLKLLTA